MNGLMDARIAHTAAGEAVDYWTQRLADRRELFIAEVSQQRRGFFDARPKGRAVAEEQFGASAFEGGEHSGHFWKECYHRDIASDVMRRTAAADLEAVLLSGREIDALLPCLREQDRP